MSSTLYVDYKFDDSYTSYEISIDEFMDTVAEYADQKHNVLIDGKPRDVYSLFRDLFHYASSDGIMELLQGSTTYYYDGGFGLFIHEKYEAPAREQWEEEKLLYNEE